MIKKLLIASAITISGLLTVHTASAQKGSDDMIPVYRWYSTVDRNFITLADNEYQEGQLLNWKYSDKTLIFYAFRSPAEDRIAVYSWFNPTTKDVVSVAEDEFSDDQMLKMGYKNKKLQFYAPIRRGDNRVAVYRWYIPKTKDWVTFPEEGDTDKLGKKGFRHKTFQYYGVKRAVDESLYYHPL